MKIIDLAICVNNIDPKGIGRIRCVRYNDYVAEKEKSVKYEEWSDTDPFIALPFLPANLNFIPSVGQAVKIINYNTDKETVNQEYIAGPFTTMYDFNSQTFTQQIENTTYGVAVKHKKDLRRTTGEYIDTKSENAFAKEDDYALYGRYGSDLLFTENGLLLRGGKLQSKENLSPKNKEKTISYPLMSKKSSILYLKKFSEKATLKKVESEKLVSDSGMLKNVIEYEVDGLNGDVNIKFYVYSVKQETKIFQSNNFNEHTQLPATAVKLINLENNITSPTFVVSGVSISDVHKEIRTTILRLHDNDLSVINQLFGSQDLHPFYYRPTGNFKNLTVSNTTEQNNKNNIFNKIRLTSEGPYSYGLVWSKLNITPRQRKVREVKEILVNDNNSPEQTFAALKSDKIYLLSTDPNETSKTIDFDSLDKYELTQQDYLQKIEPNTFSTVRGENLVRILKSIVNVVFTHRHNINKSISSQPDYQEGIELQKLIETLENDILNKSIRIN